MSTKDKLKTEKYLHEELKKESATFFELDEAFFEKLHDDIMLKVDQVEVKKVSSWQRIANRLRENAKILSQRLGAQVVMAMVVVSVIFQVYRIENRWRQTMNDFQTEAFVLQALQDPGKMSQSVLTHQNESDFFLDVANRSFDDLNLNKLDQLLGSVKRVRR